MTALATVQQWWSSRRWLTWAQALRQQLHGRGRKLAAYGGLFLGFFLLFLYLTFPYERLRDHLQQLIEQRVATRRPLQVRMATLGPWWFPGLAAEGVRIRQAAAEASEAPLDITLDHVRLRLRMLPLLTGRLSVSFEVESAGGEIVGRLADPSGEPSVDAELRNLLLQRLPMLRASLGLPMQGRVDGRIALQLPAGVEKLNGEASLQARELRIGDGKAKLSVPGMQQGFTIETLDAGALDLNITAKDGLAEIGQLTVRGPDLSLDGKGSLQLSPVVRYSRVDVRLRIAFADRYRNRNDRTRALFALMEFTPQLRDATTPDNALQFRLQGNLTGVTATPDGQNRL